LSQLIDVGKRAINLGLSGVSDTQGENERKAFGAEMQTLLEQAVEIGNTSHQDKFLFSGLQTNTQPFVINGSSLAAFAGGSGGIKLNIGPGQTVTENIEGNTLWGMVDAIRSLRDQLNNTADPNQSQAISAAVGALQEQFESVKIQSTTNGARLRQVRLTGERLEKTQIELKSLLSQKEDVNMVEAISTLRNQETVYQSVLEVGQRAISALNLFDMLS
jgi:flagellar hook-associated protein 3 FlgL